MKKLIIAILLMTSNALANTCDGIEVAKVLDGLLDVGKLYNCKLEVVRIETRLEKEDETFVDMVSYLAYGKDEFRCKTTDRVCPKANFELTLPKSCFSSEALDKLEIKHSNGYNIDGQKLRNHIQINRSEKQIKFLSFGQTELESTKRINYVQCQLEIFGE